MRVAVVGAGLAGLSAACHLAGRGHEVTVLERDAVPGGRMGRWDEGGYRFDTGPTVLTMRGILAATTAAAGVDLDDLVTLRPVDPAYRAVYADGSVLHVRRGREAMAEEIRSVCGPADAAAFDRFCGWLDELYQLEFPNFIDRNFDSVLSLARPLRPLLQLVRLGGLRKLAAVVASHFEDDRLRRLFSFQSLYAGLSPFEALAIYGVITYMDTVEGVWSPDGGMHEVAVALATAAAKAGADIRCSTPVDRIERGRVHVAGGGTVPADAVVCTPDLPVAYEELLDTAPPRTARRGEYSPSCAVWLVGTTGELPGGTSHHNVHFGSEWRSSFDALLKDGRRMPDPSILVTAAPGERRTLYVLEPVPNLDGQVDWSTERDRMRDDLRRRVANLGYPVADDEIEVERFTDPADWAASGMARGTPFALSHRFFQTGPFRPGNVDRRVPGVVFAGSGTVPGVGIPMVLVSGRLAADRVEELAR